MRDDDLVFKALADPTRRLILQELAVRDSQSLFQLVVRLIDTYQLSITRQGVSKHLALLESTGLLETHWRGKTKLHSFNRAPLHNVVGAWIDRVTSMGDGGEEP